MSKKYLILSAIVIITIIVVGIVINKGKTAAAPEKKTLEKKTITITDVRAISTVVLPIALKKGFFSKYGLDVKLIPLQTGDEALKALVAKSADIGVAAVTPYSFLAIDKPEMKIFATVAKDHVQIIANKNKGISKITDLKGKKIGYAKTTISEFGLGKFLESNGLQKEDIQWINLKPLAMPSALLSGDIDAYCIFEPTISNGAKMLGDRAIIFSNSQNTYQVVLIADQSYIKNNKDTLEKLVKALIDTEKFISENKKEAVAIAADHVKIPSNTLNNIWSNYEFKISLDNNLTDTINENLSWANDRRETKVGKLPDPANLVDRSIFDYAKSH